MYDPGDLQVFDPILSGFSVGFKDQNLFGERLFPITRVNTRNGRYRVFDRSNWMRAAYAHRAPGAVANEIVGRKWSEDTFHVSEYSLQSAVYDEEEEELNSPGGLGQINLGGGLDISPMVDATELVTRALLLEHESQVASTIRLAANYPGGSTVTLAGAQQWSDYTGGVSSTSDPVTVLRTAAITIYKNTGQWPNTMIVPFDAVGVIENHPRVVARYTYTSVFDANAWRQLLGLPDGVAQNLNVFIVDSKENTADNIDATETITSFWGQDVWLGIVNPDDGMNVMTFGKTFARPYPNGDIRPTDRWREEGRKSDLVRVSYRWDLKIVKPSAGYLIKTAVAAV
jgi:hypothetical protein